MRRQLNAIKATQFPWMLEVTKNAPQMAIMHWGQAFKNFFAGTAEHPPFKKKGQHDSFTLTNDPFTVKGNTVHIPKLGGVRMHESLRFVGKVLDGTISRTAERWFLSVTVEMPDPPSIHRESQAVGGVDLGVSALATLSTGEKIVGPKAYAAALAPLRRLSKQFSRQREAAKVRAGLQPGEPIPKGMHIPWSENMQKTQRRSGKKRSLSSADGIPVAKRVPPVDTKCRKCRSRCGTGRALTVVRSMTAMSTRRSIYGKWPRVRWTAVHPSLPNGRLAR